MLIGLVARMVGPLGRVSILAVTSPPRSGALGLEALGVVAWLSWVLTLA